MKLLRFAAIGAALLALAGPAFSQTQPVPGAVQANGQPAPVQASAIIVAPAGGGAGRGVVVAPDRPLPITCISGCSGGGGGGGGATVTATAAAPTYVEGSTDNPLSSNLTGDLRVIAKQNGTWSLDTLNTVTSITNAIGIKGANGSTIASNANPVPISDAGSSITVDGTVAVTGTFWQATQPISAASLPLPSGAATATNQTATQGSKAAGTAATNSELTGGVYNSSLPTLTNGQQAAVQLSSSGRLIVGGL